MTSLAREVLLHWCAVGLYGLAALLLAYAHIFDRRARARYGLLAAALGLVPHTVALALRWVEAGHGPYMLRYEVLSSNAWVAVAMLLLFVWRRPRWSVLGLVVLPAAVLLVGAGMFTNPKIQELPPSLRSVWLVFHISFAKVSAGAFILSVAASLLLLLKGRGGERAWLTRLPEVELLDAYAARFMGFGFLFWTVTVAAGAIWAHQSWGRYWGWDPIETWSLIVWLCYGVLLHLRYFFKLRGAAAAWTTIVCFVLLLFTVFLLPLVLPSIHEAYFKA